MIDADRRIKWLGIDASFMAAMFTEGFKIRQGYKVVKGVPEDAKVLGTSIDYDTGTPMILVHSKTFPNLKGDEKVPFIQVEVMPLIKR